MVGADIVLKLLSPSEVKVFTAARTHRDLLIQGTVQAFFGRQFLDHVYKVVEEASGIDANTYLIKFINEHLMDQAISMHAAHVSGEKSYCFWDGLYLLPKRVLCHR